MNINELQAVFFDFDGVILDSTHIKTEAFKKMYEPFGDAIVKKVLEYHLKHGGISRVEKIAYYHDSLLNTPLSKEKLAEACLQFSNRVKDMVASAAWIPGIKHFFETYHEKVDLYVVSGTPQEELTEIIEKRAMGIYFKKIMGSPVKKPVHVNSILHTEKLTPDLCFFIGDALTDYDTAVETGLHFIGIQGEINFPPGTTVLPDCVNLMHAIEAV